MITIISGSNRENNRTIHFARYVHNMLIGNNIPVQLLDLSSIDEFLLSKQIYEKQPSAIQLIQDTYFAPATFFWFFVPEYNGSYPGIVKLLLDCISTRDKDQIFLNKKACITGIASGRAGNLRGMDHLADVLNHLGVYVHPNKNPISSIYKVLDSENRIIDKTTEQTLKNQLNQLLNF